MKNEKHTCAKLTLKLAKELLRPYGVTVTRRADVGEYRVNLAGFSEATAYYTSSLLDAYGTGLYMADHWLPASEFELDLRGAR